MRTIDDTIDFDAYIRAPEEKPRLVRPIDVCDDVLALFANPVRHTGTRTPWQKLDHTWRLRRGELSIWPGMNGHGKSMLVSQVIGELMVQGERVCLASMEMTIPQVMQRLCRQILGTSTPTANQIRDVHQWTDGRLWLYDQQTEVSPERIIALARYTQAELDVHHLVVDNLLSCGISEDGDGWMSAQKAFVLGLSTHAHHTGQAVHLLAHVRKLQDELRPPSKYDIRGSASISDLADNVFIVWRNKAKEEAQAKDDRRLDDDPDCMLIVAKHRHGEWEGRVGLWYHPDAQTYTDSPAAHPVPMRFGKTTDNVEF